MLLTGTTEHTVDPANYRLSIPARIRSQWQAERDGGGWLCLPGKGCLRLYTEGGFKELFQPLMKKGLPRADLAQLQRQVFGRAKRLEEDSAGRVVLPKEHLAASGMKIEGKSEMVLVGVGNRLELYEKAKWQAEEAMDPAALQELIDRLESGEE